MNGTIDWFQLLRFRRRLQLQQVLLLFLRCAFEGFGTVLIVHSPAAAAT